MPAIPISGTQPRPSLIAMKISSLRLVVEVSGLFKLISYLDWGREEKVGRSLLINLEKLFRPTSDNFCSHRALYRTGQQRLRMQSE